MPIFALFVLVILFGMVISRATKAEGTPGGTRSPNALSDGLPAKALARGTILAQATPRYYDEQLLNYRVTEFCAKTTNPPVNEAVVAIFQALPPLKPLGEWLDAFTTERRRKCGDA